MRSKFKVEGVVTNLNYRTKEGDAAFLEIGTKLYRVNGFDANELIAAKDENRIGGYRLYAEDGFGKTLRQHYKDVPKGKVERIEIYHYSEVKPFKTLYNNEKERFIQFLEKGKDTQNYNPPNTGNDPTYYMMVFYTDESIAYAFTLVDDGLNVFFSPWDTRLLDEEIRKLIQQ